MTDLSRNSRPSGEEPAEACTRCDGTEWTSLLFGPNTSEFRELAAEQGLIYGGLGHNSNLPDRACSRCRWPVEPGWNGAEGPKTGGAYASYREIRRAVREYTLSGDLKALAISFDGLAAFGTEAALRQSSEEAESTWKETGFLPTNPVILRASLYFAQREAERLLEPLSRPWTEALAWAISDAGKPHAVAPIDPNRQIIPVPLEWVPIVLVIADELRRTFVKPISDDRFDYLDAAAEIVWELRPTALGFGRWIVDPVPGGPEG